jgi:hypothetical protein
MAGSKGKKAKIGEEHWDAMKRLGLEELRNTVYPSSNVAEPNTLYGIAGTKTPGEVAEDRRTGMDDLNRDEEPKKKGIIAERFGETKDRDQQNDRDREMEMELD